MVEPLPKVRPQTAISAPAEAQLYVYGDVLEEIRFNGSWREDRTAGGLLVGGHFRDPDSGAAYVEVEGYVCGVHVSDVGEFTQYLRVQWKAATSALRYHFPDGEIVGWYMATGLPRDPGQAELVLHNTFFNHPWQAGLWLAGDRTPLALKPNGDQLADMGAGIIAGEG